VGAKQAPGGRNDKYSLTEFDNFESSTCLRAETFDICFGNYANSPGVNIIKILSEPFLCKSVLHSFSLITVWLCNFFGKKILAQELLVKC